MDSVGVKMERLRRRSMKMQWLCFHDYNYVLYDVIESTDPDHALFVYRDQCRKCEKVRRQWSNRVRGFASNSQGWDIPTYTDFLRDLLKLRI